MLLRMLTRKIRSARISAQRSRISHEAYRMFQPLPSIEDRPWACMRLPRHINHATTGRGSCITTSSTAATTTASKPADHQGAQNPP